MNRLITVYETSQKEVCYAIFFLISVMSGDCFDELELAITKLNIYKRSNAPFIAVSN